MTAVIKFDIYSRRDAVRLVCSARHAVIVKRPAEREREGAHVCEGAKPFARRDKPGPPFEASARFSGGGFYHGEAPEEHPRGGRRVAAVERRRHLGAHLSCSREGKGYWSVVRSTGNTHLASVRAICAVCPPLFVTNNSYDVSVSFSL